MGPGTSHRFLMSQTNAPFVLHVSSVLSTQQTQPCRAGHLIALKAFLSVAFPHLLVQLSSHCDLMTPTGQVQWGEKRLHDIFNQEHPNQASAAMARLLEVQRLLSGDFMCL